MSYRDTRVLVTGGLGFIGSNLVRSLVHQGAHVTAIDNLNPQYGGNRFNVADVAQQLSLHVADICDPAVIPSLLEGRHYLFNLAAQTSHLGSMQEPYLDLQINAQAQLAIVEACRQVNPGIKIVYASTRQLYGKPRYLPVDEDHPIRPVDVNGISKLAGEQFHLLYHDVYGIRATVLRLTNTYGPGMRIKDARQTFVGFWVRRLLEKKSIPVYGDGMQLRDFTYVDDCVDALLRAGLSEEANGRVFNLGSRDHINLRDLAELLIGLGYGGEVEMVPFPPERKVIDMGDYYSDPAAFVAACGWAPAVTLEEGLRRTLEYYRANFERYV